MASEPKLSEQLLLGGSITDRVSSKRGAQGPQTAQLPPQTDPTSPPPPPQDIVTMKSTLLSPWPYDHVIHELPPKMKFLDETLTDYALRNLKQEGL